MAGLNLTSIREGIVATIQAGVGRPLNGYPYPVGNEQLPCVVVGTDREFVTYDSTLGVEPLCDATFVLVLMARVSVSLEDGQRVLDEMLSAGAGLPNSVIDAVTADRTLGGTVETCKLGTAGGYVSPEMDGGRPEAVLTAVPLQIWMRRS
jgi:hypothetical protein